MRSQCNNVLCKEISIEFRKQDIYIYSRKERKNFEALFDWFHWVEMIFPYLGEENCFLDLSRISIKERFAK